MATKIKEIEIPMASELTMAQYEALESITNDADYNITDYPNTSITNEQMAYALTCKRLFKAGEIFMCSDEGTYTKGTTYMIVENNEVKSWELVFRMPTVEEIPDDEV